MPKRWAKCTQKSWNVKGCIHINKTASQGLNHPDFIYFADKRQNSRTQILKQIKDQNETVEKGNFGHEERWKRSWVQEKKEHTHTHQKTKRAKNANKKKDDV